VARVQHDGRRDVQSYGRSGLNKGDSHDVQV
jgi:hypothetical protein